jgi:hypothetical protein
MVQPASGIIVKGQPAPGTKVKGQPGQCTKGPGLACIRYKGKRPALVIYKIQGHPACHSTEWKKVFYFLFYFYLGTKVKGQSVPSTKVKGQR